MAKGVKVRGGELRKIREERFYTQPELAELLGTTVRNLQRIEGGEVEGMGVAMFRKLAEVLKTKPEALGQRLMAGHEEIKDRRNGVTKEARKAAEQSKKLTGGATVTTTLDENVQPYSEQRFYEIPTFDMSVAAGRWIDVGDIGEVREPGMIDHGFFRIRIRGDSMQPKYMNDEIVEFRCMREGRDSLEIGANYYVQKIDDTATFKQLEKIEEDKLIFRAINRRKYKEPLEVPRAEIVRMARAMGKYVPD